MDSTEHWLPGVEIVNHLGLLKESICRWLEWDKTLADRMEKLWKFKAFEVDIWIEQ